MISKITNYVDAAINKLEAQYKTLTNIPAIVSIDAQESQNAENMLWDLFTKRDIYTAFGIQLDGIGSIVGQLREGLDDDTYRIRIFLKIAQNNSQGTPEELISLYKALMRADYIMYQEPGDASIIMEAVNPNPIGDIQEIKAAMLGAKAAGVKLFLEESDGQPIFSTLEDTSPNTAGAGDVNDASLGGIISSLF